MMRLCGISLARLIDEVEEQMVIALTHLTSHQLALVEGQGCRIAKRTSAGPDAPPRTGTFSLSKWQTFRSLYRH